MCRHERCLGSPPTGGCCPLDRVTMCLVMRSHLITRGSCLVVAALPVTFAALALATSLVGGGVDSRTAAVPITDDPAALAAPIGQAAPSSAWGRTATELPGTLVAVIDTGVSPTSSLAGRVEVGQSFVGGDATADENGHGTAVAGIIAGPMGVCQKCRILPLRVSAGASGIASSDNIAAAVDAAVGLGAAVVNLSMIASNPTEVERAAFARATDAGVVVVAAAGNASSSIPAYPGSYPGVLSVGAAGDDGVIAAFSNRGSWVSVLAPACGRSNTPDGAQVLFCGTSASAPYVAGVAAVLRAAVPTATAANVIQAIRRSSHPVEGAADGLIDPAAALLAIGGAPPVVATTNATSPTPKVTVLKRKRAKGAGSTKATRFLAKSVRRSS